MRSDAWLGRLVRLSTVLSAVALAVMMLTSVADVVMANLFNRPITGAFDVVETTLVLTVFLGFPATFAAGGHIAVDVVDFFVSPATLARLKIVAKLLTCLFLAFLAWQMFAPAQDAFRFGERKQELGLPLFVLWIPMIFGIALSAVMTLVSLRSRNDAAAPPKE
jgi:TRAP-type C4-dicarboxylate transport system permease small subunit